MVIDGRIQSWGQHRVGLNEAIDGLKQYVDHMTDGKVLILPILAEAVIEIEGYADRKH